MALYIKRRDPNSVDYVDNKQFTAAMMEYSHLARIAEKECFDHGGTKDDVIYPPITTYIAECIMKIARGLASRPNFSGYSYREEFVSHAIENCVKVVSKFDPTVVTRSGKPNAFAYFTQICYFAFLRVLKKERMQEDIKITLLDQSNLSDFAETDDTRSSASLESVKKRLDTSGRRRDKKKVLTKNSISSLDVEFSVENFLEEPS